MLHVACVRHRSDRPPPSLICVYLSGKYGETSNSYILLVENGMGVAT
jgi:hypothetical protein